MTSGGRYQSHRNQGTDVTIHAQVINRFFFFFFLNCCKKNDVCSFPMRVPIMGNIETIGGGEKL